MGSTCLAGLRLTGRFFKYYWQTGGWAFRGWMLQTGHFTPNPGGGRSAWIAYELAISHQLTRTGPLDQVFTVDRAAQDWAVEGMAHPTV